MNQDTSAHTEQSEHPRGTLAIVAVYGILFLLGWLFMYHVVFGGRGGLHTPETPIYLPAGSEP